MMLDPNNEADLEEIKKAIREDYSDDDIGITRAVLAATAYIKGAVGTGKPSFYTQDNDIINLINLSILLLTDHYYHVGSATIESSSGLKEYDLGFTSIILQLKTAYQRFSDVEEGSVVNDI